MWLIYRLNQLNKHAILDTQGTGGPRYLREIGTPKISQDIINLHIKGPRITVNLSMGSRNRSFFNRICAKSQIKRPHTMRAACTFVG
jgi:hypothetical protein